MLDFITTYILIPTAHAQTASIGVLMARINRFVINPVISVLFVVAFVVFVWGLFEFFKAKSSGGGDDGIEKGKRHIVWGIIGMVIMVSVFGIMQLLINSLGVRGINPNSPNIGNLSGN
jgi:hypothetical protein